MITMRTVRGGEEPRHHRAADDLAGQRFEIIIGKWLGAMLLYLCVLAMSMINIALLFAWGKPDLKPVLIAYLGLILQGGMPARHRRLHLDHHAQPDHRRRRHFLCLPAALAAELVHGVRHHRRRPR